MTLVVFLFLLLFFLFLFYVFFVPIFYVHFGLLLVFLIFVCWICGFFGFWDFWIVPFLQMCVFMWISHFEFLNTLQMLMQFEYSPDYFGRVNIFCWAWQSGKFWDENAFVGDWSSSTASLFGQKWNQFRMRIGQPLKGFGDEDAFDGAWSISTANLFGNKRNESRSGIVQPVRNIQGWTCFCWSLKQ